MAEFEKQSSAEPRDFKERFEFEFTVDKNIICQRYFKILNFNPTSLRSYELTEAIRKCVSIIDNDLKDKTQSYLEMFAPHIFNTVEQMNEFFKNEDNAKRVHLGEGIIVRDSKTDYVWTGTVAKPLGSKFDDGELTSPLGDNMSKYKFVFKVDGREACAYEWEGMYPKFVREKVDLANKRGKYEGEDVTRLSFEQYLLYKMVEGKSDLVYGLIKTICKACSLSDNNDYTTSVDAILSAWAENSKSIAWRVLK